MSLTASGEKAKAGDPRPANSPVGIARGIYPGRVAWVHDPDATDWPGDDGDTSQPYWHTDTCTDPDIVNGMMSKALRTLAGQTSDEAAWEAIFKYFNQQAGRGNVGYTPGEKISIKVNFVLMLVSGGNSKSMSYYDQIDNSPQLTIALLRQLIDKAGVAPEDISIGDPQNRMPDHWYDMVHAECPGVVYLCTRNSSQSGRTTLSFDYNAPFYFSDPCSAHWNGVSAQDYIPDYFAQADYFINFPILKSHNSAGVTIGGKNHYGSLMRAPNERNYYNMHNTRPYNSDNSPFATPGMGYYRANVDLMGHPKLGGKTLLVLIDGLYGGRSWDSHPIRWEMEPFNGDWPSSIFLSQDQVAADSVAFDFLVNEWDGPVGTINGYPQYSGTDDYLKEAALIPNPPSGTVYDPANSGGLTRSLGVHEHWNNSIDKQYSRNLGTGNGIELVTPTLTSVNGPVKNINTGNRYDYIQYAIEDADPCDLIIAGPGVYNEDINFLGKRLTVSSSDPDDPNVVEATIIKGSDVAVTFDNNEDANSVLTGFTITGANTGIYCDVASPAISKCTIKENKDSGIELHESCMPLIEYCEITCNQGSGIYMSSGGNVPMSPFNMPNISNCVIAANRLNGIYGDVPLVANCTIAANGQKGVLSQWLQLDNSIVYYNNLDTDAVQIESGLAIVSYSDIQGNWPGEANIDQDPCFAEVGFWNTNGTPFNISDDFYSAGDYHLKSQAGRWLIDQDPNDPNSEIEVWFMDDVTSPCIDAGDPNSPICYEPYPNGGKINMGAYGGTLQTSMSPNDVSGLGYADLPNPVDGDLDAGLNVILSWKTDDAASYEIYFGTDELPLFVQKQSGNQFDPGILDPNTQYNWRVDVIDINGIRTVGDIWSFTTGNYLIVDDFESYGDEENHIWGTWTDGWDDDNNGSLIGMPCPDFDGPENCSEMEKEIVHSGNQSVSLFYDNSFNFSEVTANTSDLLIGSDWTKKIPEKLVLWFYGDPNNPPMDQLYVKLNGSKVLYGGDMNNLTIPGWCLCEIDILDFNQSLYNIETITIGLERTETSDDQGIVFIDDIRLY